MITFHRIKYTTRGSQDKSMTVKFVLFHPFIFGYYVIYSEMIVTNITVSFNNEQKHVSIGLVSYLDDDEFVV